MESLAANTLICCCRRRETRLGKKITFAALHVFRHSSSETEARAKAHQTVLSPQHTVLEASDSTNPSGPPWGQQAGSTLIAISKFLGWTNILQMMPVQLNFGSGFQSTGALTQKRARMHTCSIFLCMTISASLTFLTFPVRLIRSCCSVGC